MYPLKFHPVYRERIWGGSTLAAQFGRQLPTSKIGESWDVSCHPNGPSIIANGPWMGKSLTDIVQHYGPQLLGTSPGKDSVRRFPLLMKLIDAQDRLSVQVHPTDEWAFSHSAGDLGKAELWYVIHASPGASIIYGLAPGEDRESFTRALQTGSIEGCLRHVPVREGDVFDIPAGLVHALGAGVLVAEIQQNSDTTYRIYDYDRTDEAGLPRELHVSNALEVMDFNQAEIGARGPLLGFALTKNDSYTKRLMAANRHFAVELIDLLPGGAKETNYTETANGAKFLILTSVKGGCDIVHQAGRTNLAAGDSCLIPASMGRFRLIPTGDSCRIMRSFVPDLESDIVKPLTDAGYDKSNAGSVIGGL